jgi:hypothetical protein
LKRVDDKRTYRHLFQNGAIGYGRKIAEALAAHDASAERDPGPGYQAPFEYFSSRNILTHKTSAFPSFTLSFPGALHYSRAATPVDTHDILLSLFPKV